MKLQAVMTKNPRRSRPSQKGRRRRPAPAGEETSPQSPETPSVAVWEIKESDDDDDDGSRKEDQPGAADLFRAPGMRNQAIQTNYQSIH